MRNSKVFLLIGLMLLTIQGCSSKPEYQGYLSKEEVFKIDPEADLFEFDDHVYKGNIDWIEKEELTKNKKLGTIHTGIATKLPKGAEIYSTHERVDILIVKYKGIEKRYLLMMGE